MEKASIKKIVCFDFDKTLIHTMLPEEGRQIWLDRKGENFPHPVGWWSKPESLDTDIFYPAINEWTLREYLKYKDDPEVYLFLATGRMEILKEHVVKILDMHEFDFHDVYCNNAGSTFKFKRFLFESKIKEFKNATEFIMYDDRHEHLTEFVKWGEEQPIKVSVIDVINKKKLL